MRRGMGLPFEVLCDVDNGLALTCGLVSAVAGRGRRLSWAAFLLAAGLCLAAALP